MARPQKEGLEYFPLVTAFDEKIELIIAEFGSEGLGIIIGLFQRIYSNGYYINWNEDTLMLFATKHINTDQERIKAVLNKCIERNIFNKQLFQQYGILTSRGIQKQYLKVCKDSRRKLIKFIKEYCLVTDPELLGIISEFITINTEEMPIITEETPPDEGLLRDNSGGNTQSKVKESKVKKRESKEEESKVNGADQKENAASLPDAAPVFIKVLDYFSLKSGVLTPNPKDIEMAQQLISKNIPYGVILQGIDEAFKKYKPKREGNKINSLRYCEGCILDLWEIEKAKEVLQGGGDQQSSRQIHDESAGEPDEELNPADYGLV